MSGRAREGMWIRSQHPDAYKSGEWGQIRGSVTAGGNLCWQIAWPDGATDVWRQDDPPAEYELSRDNKGATDGL